MLGKNALDFQHFDIGIFSNSGLREIEFPATLKEVGYNAFNGCKSLQSIRLNSGLKSICCSAFKGCAIKSIVFPATVEDIQRGAFYNNRLEEISFQANSELREVGEYAFGHKNGLRCAGITIPTGARVAENAFEIYQFFEPGVKAVAVKI